jgi:uncharacterized protein (TIGR02996 family)
MTDAAAAEQMGLLADIIAHPGEDGPRLIYADWLEDSGGGVRAEFIRAGVAGRPTVYRLRGGTYMTFTHQWPWREHTVHCPDHVEDCTVGGGFVEAVRLPLSAWMAHGPALTRAHPLTRVELSDRGPGRRRADGMGATQAWEWRLWHGSWDGIGSAPQKPCWLPLCFKNDTPEWAGDYALFPSPEAARDGLSDLCLSWARAVDRGGAGA